MSFGRVAAAAVALALAVPLTVSGQCRSSVRPQPGDLGYRDRSYACEGFYVGTQNAPLGVQVVSFLRGGWPPDLERDQPVTVHAPPGLRQTSSLGDDVLVVGRARTDATRWALDGSASPDRPMVWDLSKVFTHSSLEFDQVGLFGETSTGLGGPVFLPLGVGPHQEGEARPTELVVRVIGAADVCWAFHPASQCTEGAAPLPADGYFAIDLPSPNEPGEARLLVWWRQQGEAGWGAPESVRIYRW